LLFATPIFDGVSDTARSSLLANRFAVYAEELEDDSLADLVQRFVDLAHDTVVAAGGRIVKTIGDEVMFVTDTVGTAAWIAVQLSERSLGDDLLPETRAGIAAGHLVAREGDYFGPVVNLAARLTELARPGTVLGSSEIGAALEHEIAPLDIAKRAHFVHECPDDGMRGFGACHFRDRRGRQDERDAVHLGGALCRCAKWRGEKRTCGNQELSATD